VVGTYPEGNAMQSDNESVVLMPSILNAELNKSGSAFKTSTNKNLRNIDYIAKGESIVGAPSVENLLQ